MNLKRRDFVRVVGAAAMGAALPGGPAAAMAARRGMPPGLPSEPLVPPDIFFEHAVSFAQAQAWNEVAFWRNTKNVFMMARHDFRGLFHIDDWVPGGNVGPGNHPLAPHIFGESLYWLHRFIYDNWASRWAAVNKPFKIAPCWVGLDAIANDNEPFKLRLFKHPDDEPRVGGDFLTYFSYYGRREVGGYLENAFPTYRGMLEADQAMGGPKALDHIVATYDNFGPEAAVDFHNPANWLAALQDPRADDPQESINLTGHTLNQWAAAFALDLYGNPLPPVNPCCNSHHPANWEAVRQADEAGHCFQATSIYRAVSEPFQVAFDRPVPHGSWQRFTSGRPHPVYMRPTQYRYLMDNDFALGLSVPVCYGDNGPFAHYGDDVGAQDWRYQAPLNLIRHLSDPAVWPDWPFGDPAAFEPGGPKHHQRQIVASMANCMKSYHDLSLTDPAKDYTLSISCLHLNDFTPGSAEYIARAEYMADCVEYLVRNARLRQIWFHTGGYYESAGIRERCKYQVERINARFGL